MSRLVAAQACHGRSGRANALTIVLITVLLLLVSGYYGLRFLFLGRFTHPTTAEFAALARNHQDLVRAIRDYRAERGILPETIDDLVPDYLGARPAGQWPTFNNGVVMVFAGVPHTYVCYHFDAGQEGWYAAGDFGTGRLPVEIPPLTRPERSGEALVSARLAEYDRRLRGGAPPVDARLSDYYARRNHTQKIAYLVSLGRKTQALEACRAASAAFPDWWRPPVVAAAVAEGVESRGAEEALRRWVAQHPSFVHHWYLYRHYRDAGRDDEALASLREAVKHPLDDGDPDGGWVPDAYAFDAAAYACRRRQPELALEITRIWERPRGVYNYHNDNLHAFRAAAELALGRFDEAKTDLDRVVAAGRTQGLWAGNLDELGRAVVARDRAFAYDAGETPNVWTALPAPE